MMALYIDQEIADMQQMTSRKLRDRYAVLFDEQSHSNNKVWLIKKIAWRLQAQTEGGLSQRAHQRAEELANEADLRLQAPLPKRERRPAQQKVAHQDRRLPIPGTILTREYKGRMLQVTVLQNGFEHDGEVFQSLSAVAKSITGSHTNGFLFFRLNGKGIRS